MSDLLPSDREHAEPWLLVTAPGEGSGSSQVLDALCGLGVYNLLYCLPVGAREDRAFVRVDIPWPDRLTHRVQRHVLLTPCLCLFDSVHAAEHVADCGGD